MKIVNTNRLLAYRDFIPYGPTWVETGSSAGDGIQRALVAGFSNVYSIEASYHWYSMCYERFGGDRRVHLFLGRSIDILSTMNFGAQTIFYLDAHPSGPGSAGHADLMKKGAQSEWFQDRIVKSELAIIFNRFTRPIIIIDDQQGLDPTSQTYIDMLLSFYPSYLIEFYDENLEGSRFFKDKLLVARYAI